MAKELIETVAYQIMEKVGEKDIYIGTRKELLTMMDRYPLYTTTKLKLMKVIAEAGYVLGIGSKIYVVIHDRRDVDFLSDCPSNSNQKLYTMQMDNAGALIFNPIKP